MVSPALLLVLAIVVPQDGPSEADPWVIETFTPPDDVVLEVGGLALLPDGRPLLSTRRGEVWIVNGAYGDVEDATFTRFAEGLHEPLGLLVHDGWIYTAQRGELSRLRDVDGDDRIDELETVCDAWSISGNYHEYNFGPRLDDEGNFWITTNKPFGDEPFGRADWRGFALRVTPDGRMLPTACGLRSPAGLEKSPWGEMFYTDNQGEWCGASKLALLAPGDFHGHPWGTFSCARAEWPYDPVPEPPNGVPMLSVEDSIPSFRPPAVWFPYDKAGKSPAGLVWDTTGGRFGPFDGQLFVGDQHHAALFRVALEQVGGHWQGAVFPFRYGFRSGVLRLAWGRDASLFVGCTNRGWGSRGAATEGFERVRFRGGMPFEIRTMELRPDGFELAFTRPVDRATAEDPASWTLASYTYLLHETYGSPEIDTLPLALERIEVAADGLRVRLVLTDEPGLRAGFVHELSAHGVRAHDGAELRHAEAWYTAIRLAQ